MLVIIDNYDSFTYNLYQMFAVMVEEVVVVRNDSLTLEQLREMKPSHIVISPGPGNPEDAGISIEVVKHFAGKIPILGVCLGHQAITVAYGGIVKRASRLMHGKVSALTHEGKGIFVDLPPKFKVMRYHSLLTDEDSLPEELEITARTIEGEIMGIKHRSQHVYGVQFHPEAYLTEYGKELLKNFLLVKVGMRD